LPGEGERHKRIRKRVEREARNYLKSTGRESTHHVRAAHERGAGTIGLYMGAPSRRTRMSDADLVVVNDKNEAVCIIEVKDRDVSPKSLFGIVGATSLCDRIRHREYGERPFREASLYIVVNAECFADVQSMKGKQVELINRALDRGLGSLSKILICSENEFTDRFGL
jgi:hypothetical protein